MNLSMAQANRSISYKSYLAAHGRYFGALILELCHYCPVGCSHCHIHSDAGKSDRLSEDQVKAAIRAFSAYPTAEYVFCTGGEPFTYLDLLATALEETKRHNLVTYTLTSGVWATNPERARNVLRSLPKIDLFAVSFDRYHEEKIGLTKPIEAVRAGVEAGSKVFVCIGHLGIDDPFRQRILDSLGPDLLKFIDVIWYPLLARGKGASLPELEGRDLSRTSKAPCFSINAPLVTSDGKVVACCQTTQANSARANSGCSLVYGRVEESANAFKQMLDDPFNQAIRTLGASEAARLAGVEIPNDFDNWDMCHACEFLQQTQNADVIRKTFRDPSEHHMRLSSLDYIISEGTIDRCREVGASLAEVSSPSL